MSSLVLKFGGTSVATVELIKSAAQIIKKEYDNGHNVAVVVSAMSGTTNNLINFVNNINVIDNAEYDVVVSSGEQITSGLMSLALQEIGVPARSWLSWQLPIITSGPNKNSVIKKIIPDKIIDCFEQKNGILSMTRHLLSHETNDFGSDVNETFNNYARILIRHLEVKQRSDEIQKDYHYKNSDEDDENEMFPYSMDEADPKSKVKFDQMNSIDMFLRKK